MLNFVKGYNFNQAHIEILNFAIKNLDEKIDPTGDCPFKNFSQKDILEYFKNVKVTNSVGDYQFLFAVFNCKIEGQLRAYGKIWEFDMYYGRAHWNNAQHQDAFKTYFFCDAPKCKPRVIDQYDEE